MIPLWIRGRNMSWMITQLGKFLSGWTTIPRGFQLMEHTDLEEDFFFILCLKTILYPVTKWESLIHIDQISK